MSSDAKAWTDNGWIWLLELETCENKGKRMRWEVFEYTNGSPGLRGYCC